MALKLKQKLNSGQNIYGTCILSTSPIWSKVVKGTGLDFVFLDADHSYESVTEDLNAWFPKLKKDAIFAGHDYNNPLFGVREAVENFFTEKGLPFDLCGVFWEDPEIPVTAFPRCRGIYRHAGSVRGAGRHDCRV